ncbi:hypothetical protein J437_LFUL012071 [Ladona fulva]|uniref:Adenylate kinase n=1 Tax=Ladona fulva TaxID=123851 RepID=A0A8K0KCS6_LADFU|nr:hypothetical protein J437_LFUL012071 [Ladona fulva]
MLMNQLILLLSAFIMDYSKENIMKIPPSFIPYLEKHRIYGFFQDEDATRKADIEPKEANEKNLNLKIDDSGTSQELPTGLSKENISTLNVKRINDDENVRNNILFNKEQLEYCEKVISDWRKIRRSKKWFSIRHLSWRNDTEDDDEFPSTFEKTPQHIGPRFSLTFHTKEKLLKKSEASDLYPTDISEENGITAKQSIKTFDVKFSQHRKGASPDGSKNSLVHLIRLSIMDPEQTGEFDEKQKKYEEEKDDDHFELSGDNKNDVTPFVIKLVQETANEIMRKIYGNTASSYHIWQEREQKKPISFTRGPYMIPRVVILGPPGSGKSLQASLLAKKLNLIHIEMDEVLLRENKRTNKIPKKMMDSNLRDSDLLTEIFISVLKKRFLEEDCLTHGWVLTGFPLTATQALALDKLETSPNRFVYLEKSLDVCIDVLLTRIYNMETGQPLLVSNHHEDEEKSNIEDYPDHDTGLITVLDNKYLMESKGAMGNTCLIRSIARSAAPDLTILKQHGKYVKAIHNSLSQHEASKSMVLHYYGGWCKKLKVDNLPPQRVHEAILSVVVGPFPSFEEATIYDRTAKKISMAYLSSEIESELISKLNEFLSRELPDTSDTSI